MQLSKKLTEPPMTQFQKNRKRGTEIPVLGAGNECSGTAHTSPWKTGFPETRANLDKNRKDNQFHPLKLNFTDEKERFRFIPRVDLV
ncbi:hypothetical protein JTE90_015217 [Oedothorax gibbosus]|uniref:Uncharacterized protein n=1 Tax=Oedothorax gibbosus TaxID=931172 RepID=A0AAV6V9Q1_9ARAC|nr:hypothetical protein JTE90_015217 [Oedothorax gibbosus]